MNSTIGDELTRRAIVILSDGVDTVPQSTLEDAKEAAARDAVMIFALTTTLSEFDANGEGDEAVARARDRKRRRAAPRPG